MADEEYDLYRDSMDDLINILKIDLLIISGVLAALALIFRANIVSESSHDFVGIYFYSGIFVWILSVSLVGVTIARTRPTHFTPTSDVDSKFLKRGGAITSAKELHNYVTFITSTSILSIILFVTSILSILIEEILDISNESPFIIILLLLLAYAILVVWAFGRFTSPLLVVSSLVAYSLYIMRKKFTISPENVHLYISELNEIDGLILKDIYESDSDEIEVDKIDTLVNNNKHHANRVLPRLENMEYIYQSGDGKYGTTFKGSKIGKGKWFFRYRVGSAARNTPERLWAPIAKIIETTPLGDDESTPASE